MFGKKSIVFWLISGVRCRAEEFGSDNSLLLRVSIIQRSIRLWCSCS